MLPEKLVVFPAKEADVIFPREGIDVFLVNVRLFDYRDFNSSYYSHFVVLFIFDYGFLLVQKP